MRAAILILACVFVVAGCALGPQDVHPAEETPAPDCDDGGCSFDNGPSTACPAQQTSPDKSPGPPPPGCLYVPLHVPHGTIGRLDAGPHKI